MKAISAILKILGILVIVLIILIGLLSFVPRLFGWESANIISGSMEPAIPVGSLVIAGTEDCESIEVGDIIMYRSGNTPITHRVVWNDTENRKIHTKGDANLQEDMYPVSYNLVIGKVLVHVPYLGNVLQFFSPLPGKICGLIILAAGVALIAGGSHISRKKTAASEE